MTDQLSLLHIIAGAGHGGAETFCLDTILALDEMGVRQRVICRPHSYFIEKLDQRGIPYDLLNFSIFDRLGFGTARIKKITASFKPSLVHAWLGRAASFVPVGLDVPVLGWFGGYYNLKRYKTSDFYLGVTENIVRHIGEKLGTPDKVFLGHTFGTLEEKAMLDRTLLQTPENAPVVLLLSRMHQKKGIDVLLRAAVQLPGVYFWLAGEGPDRKKYEKMAQEFGISGRVRFLGWRNDRAALLQAANVCVLPSRYEPFGTVIVEAWYMRIPLVATRADGARQHIVHKENGLLCAIDDADELAEQIGLALSDNDLRDRIIEGGFSSYERKFSKKVVMDALLNTYKEITNANINRTKKFQHTAK